MRYWLTVLLFSIGNLQAEVLDQSDSGFVLQHQATVQRSTTEAWNALVEDISRWWDPDHTFSGDSNNLSIDARPQGCFCEQLESGGVRHLSVVFAQPGRLLRMTGGLGPLQGEAVSGVMTWRFEAGDAGTVISMTYSVGGYRPQGLGDWAGPVDQVNGHQFQRFIRFLESGDPNPSKGNEDMPREGKSEGGAP